MHHPRRFAGHLAAIACATTALMAWAQSPGGQIEAKSIGDRVLINVLLQTEAFQKETHVVIDYAASEAFAMHRNVAGSLAFGEDEQTLKVLGDAFRIEVPRDAISVAGDPFIDEFTGRYSNELDNVDVSAIVGWPTLAPFALGSISRPAK